MKTLALTLGALVLTASLALAQDVCAPAKVTSFSITQWYGAIQVDWTATGDDCNTGNASTYELRYSTSPITDTNWQSAAVAISDVSATNGNQDSFCLTVSPCSTATRYFAVFLIDDAGNRSPIGLTSGNARCTPPYTTCP